MHTLSIAGHVVASAAKAPGPDFWCALVVAHEVGWKQIRKFGNTTFLSQVPEYKAWKMRKESCALTCTENLRSGKSVLLANIVDDLNLEAATQTTIAYFFCQHDASESLKARIIIGALARQLLHLLPDLENASYLSHDGLLITMGGLLCLF
jgi:hypothetical protein